jgi:hypothetical protein
MCAVYCLLPLEEVHRGLCNTHPSKHILVMYTNASKQQYTEHAIGSYIASRRVRGIQINLSDIYSLHLGVEYNNGYCISCGHFKGS